MSLESTRIARRGADMPKDKPEVDPGEHGNLERPGAALRPTARRGWEVHARYATKWRAPVVGGWR